MSNALEFIIYGVLLGTTYGLIALPISLVHATTHSVDAAVGGYAVVAGVIAGTVGGVWGIALGILAGTLSAAVMGVLFVALEARGVGDPITIVLVSFGAATFLESLVLSVHGRDPVLVRTFRSFWKVGDISLNPQAVVNFGVGVLIAGALVVVLVRSSAGRVIRATADRAAAAELAGIPVRTVKVAAVTVGGFLAAVAGVLLMYTVGVSYHTGMHLTLTAIGAAVIFSFSGPLHSFLGAVLLGVIESLVGGYTDGGFATALPFLFIFCALAFHRADSLVARA